jgi:hypothetical protein
VCVGLVAAIKTEVDRLQHVEAAFGLQAVLSLQQGEQGGQA